MIRALTVALIVLSSATSVLAGETLTPIQAAEHIFKAADSNKDGVLTETEHDAAGLGRYGAAFVDFDADTDSKVTWDEYKAVFERHHGATDERSS